MLMSVTTTLAPLAANARHVAAPMPLAPPVMTQTLLSNSILSLWHFVSET
jgi:hypothetical protein